MAPGEGQWRGRWCRWDDHRPVSRFGPATLGEDTFSPLLANIMLDPLDKELERRGLRFARYADDFLVLVKSLRAAQRVMQSIGRFVEGRLRLVVNRQKSRAARLSECAFLGFQIIRGRIVWTEKALQRFKERIQEITSRSRGVSTFCMLRELRRYAVGWMNYFGLSQT